MFRIFYTLYVFIDIHLIKPFIVYAIRMIYVPIKAHISGNEVTRNEIRDIIDSLLLNFHPSNS